MKLHVHSQDGALDRRIAVAGDTLTIGRSAECDLVIDRKDISRRHARLMAGVVVEDLGSRNGTFVGGSRIAGATVVGRQSIRIGDSNFVTIEVEADDPLESGMAPDPEATLAGGGVPVAPPAVAVGSRPESLAAEVRERLEAEAEGHRASAELLRRDVARLERELAAARERASDRRELDECQAEKQRLLERVESLKSEIESREREDAGSLQAKLAQDELASVLRRTGELERALASAEARAAAAVPAVEPSGSASSAAQIARADRAEERCRALESELSQARARADEARRADAQLRESTELVRRLREELAAARCEGAASSPAAPAAAPAATTPVSALVERLTRDNAALRQELETLRGRRPAAAGGSSPPEPFSTLQREVEQLRRENQSLQDAVSAAGRAVPSEAEPALAREADELRARVRQLERDLLKAQVSHRTPAPLRQAAPDGAAASGLWTRLIERDAQERSTAISLSPDEFLAIEQHRCFREVERLVTRLAGGFFQLYHGQTMLPGVEGENSFRSCARAVLDRPDDESARQQIVEYVDLLASWLGASVQAYRIAAQRFAGELKSELSESALTKDRPVPAYVKLTGQSEGEMWKRACNVLRDLTASVVEERIEKHAREVASEVMRLEAR